MNNSFVEVSIFQVKPSKIEDFERLLNEVVSFQKQQSGLIDMKYMKRTHQIDLDSIKEGLPAKRLTRIVKCVKYVLYWEFEEDKSHGKALKNLFDKYNKDINRCLIVPADKFIGERIY